MKKQDIKAITLSSIGIDQYNRYKILLVGCGGTGSLMLTGLARLSETLRQLNSPEIFTTVMDNDIFESHNIGKQACSPSDIGQSKAKIAVERLNRFYGLDWIYKDEWLEDTPDGYDIIIAAVDNVKARLKIFNSDSTIIDIGNGDYYGQVILSKKGIAKNTEDLFKISSQENDTVSCSAIESLTKQSLFINTFAAMYASQMLSDLLINRYIEYNQIFFNIKPFNVKQKLDLL